MLTEPPKYRDLYIRYFGDAPSYLISDHDLQIYVLDYTRVHTWNTFKHWSYLYTYERTTDPRAKDLVRLVKASLESIVGQRHGN